MAIDFDGSSALWTTTTPGYNANGVYGSLWVFPTAYPATTATIFARVNPLTFVARMTIQFLSSGKFQMHTRAAVGSSTITSTTAIPALDQWYHICYFNTIDRRDLFWNGADQVTSTSSVNAGAVTATSVGARITAATPTFTEHFEGRVAELYEEYDDSGLMSAAEITRRGLSSYSGRMKPNDTWMKYSLPQWRYWPFIRSQTSWGTVGTPLTSDGSPAEADHVPIIGHKPSPCRINVSRIVSLGGIYQRGRIILGG